LAAIREVINSLEKSLQGVENEDTAAKRLELATWRILLGEMLFQQGTNASLWSSSLDLFDAGLSEYLKVEEMIASQPELESELIKDPNLAMRLDSARTRMGAIVKRQALSREQERLRLNELRELAGIYKQLLADMSQSELMFQIGDFAKAREASNRALVKLTQIYEVAERRKDFNLLKDEPEVNPRLDLVELQKPVTPLSIELVSGLKSQQALATVKLACNAEQVDKVLLDEAAIMALSVIDGRAVSGKAPESPPNPKDPLANYVLGAVAESKGLELVKGQAYSSTAHQEAAKLFTEAKQRFSEAASGIKQAGQDGSGVNKLAQEINGRREKLESPNLAIAEANAKTVAGDLGEAVFVLREASLRHHSPAVWTALLQACRRGNQSIIEGVELGLGELSENRLLDETSENSILAVLQYWNRQALNQIGQQGSEKVSQEFKAAYKSAILSAERQLQSLGPTERL
jgi:tetratricopeptide (TPR) repeat protein